MLNTYIHKQIENCRWKSHSPTHVHYESNPEQKNKQLASDVHVKQ
jgi:hypothetical protein